MKYYSIIAALLILCFAVPAQAETCVFITKSAMGNGMLAIAEEPYAADKMRTSTLSLTPDEDGKWLVKVWVDSYGKQVAIEAHGYPILEEWIEEQE